MGRKESKVDDGLTEKQLAIYDFIFKATEDLGRPPTIREIGKEFDIKSPNGVMAHLNALVKKGKIGRSSKSSRGIVLVGYRLKLVPVEE